MAANAAMVNVVLMAWDERLMVVVVVVLRIEKECRENEVSEAVCRGR